MAKQRFIEIDKRFTSGGRVFVAISTAKIMAQERLAYHTLIVDDELDICFLLRSILNRKNTTVTCANSIGEAKAELNRQAPDIMFLDNALPDGIGMDLIGFVKEHCPNTKIIVISAHDSAANQKQAIKSGAQKFLPKPFMIEDLDKTLHDLYD